MHQVLVYLLRTNEVSNYDLSKVTPEATANVISMLTFWWLQPLMILGAQRPLQPTDLYKMDEKRTAKVLSEKFELDWARRIAKCQEYNAKVAKGEIKLPLKQRLLSWRLGKEQKEKRWKQWCEKDGKRQPNFFWAALNIAGWRLWSAAVFRFFSDTLQTFSPLLLKHIVSFGTETYEAHAAGLPLPNIGRGIGLAFGLFLMQFLAAICQAQFFYRGGSSGVLIRGGLVVSLFDRSVDLSSKSRIENSNGKLVGFPIYRV